MEIADTSDSSDIGKPYWKSINVVISREVEAYVHYVLIPVAAPATPLDQGAFALPDTPPLSSASVEKRSAVGEEEVQPKRTKQGSPSQAEKEKKIKEKRPAPQPPALDKQAAKASSTNKSKDSSANVPLYSNDESLRPSEKRHTSDDKLPPTVATTTTTTPAPFVSTATSTNSDINTVEKVPTDDEPTRRDLKSTSSPHKKRVESSRQPSTNLNDVQATTPIQHKRDDRSSQDRSNEVASQEVNSTSVVHENKISTPTSNGQQSPSSSVPKLQQKESSNAALPSGDSVDFKAAVTCRQSEKSTPSKMAEALADEHEYHSCKVPNESSSTVINSNGKLSNNL